MPTPTDSPVCSSRHPDDQRVAVSKRVPTMVTETGPPAAKRKPPAPVVKATPVPKGQATLGSFFAKKTKP